MNEEGLPASGSRLPAVAGRRPGGRPWWARLLAAAWLAGALVTWNMVFDAHIVKGARDYVDRQQLFIDGRGPRQDMDRAMAAARASGLRSASLWTTAEVLTGLALWLIARSLRHPSRDDPAR